MNWPWILLLIPVSFFAGWLFSQYSNRRQTPRNDFSSEYFRGLNYLLNEEQDKALTIFLRLIEEDEDTIDTHFALARIYRQKGELEKAIQLHQNLIAKPTLSLTNKSKSLLELGRDYLQAGWLDRAERLFKEVISIGLDVDEASRFLLMIYHQEKEWQKAIDASKALNAQDSRQLKTTIAQYYCELSDAALRRGEDSVAEQYGRQALGIDDKCARASIILGRIFKSSEQYKKAIKHFLQIEQQDIEFLPVVITDLIECHRELGTQARLVDYLLQVEENYPELALLEPVSQLIEKEQGADAVISYLAGKLKTKPTMCGAKMLLAMQRKVDCPGASQSFCDSVLQTLETVSASKPDFQCRQCGYTAQKLYWSCPSCKSWGQIKPVSCEVL